MDLPEEQLRKVKEKLAELVEKEMVPFLNARAEEFPDQTLVQHQLSYFMHKIAQLQIEIIKLSDHNDEIINLNASPN